MTTCVIERFTQTDPLQGDPGDPLTSRYVYGNDNPAMFTDPSGMRGQLFGTPNPILLGRSSPRPKVTTTTTSPMKKAVVSPAASMAPVDQLGGRGGSPPLVTFAGFNETGGISCTATAFAGVNLQAGTVSAGGHIGCEGFDPPLEGFVGTGRISIRIRQGTPPVEAIFDWEAATGTPNIPLLAPCAAGCLGEYQTVVEWQYTAPFSFASLDFGCAGGNGTITCRKSYFVTNNRRSANRHV